MLLSQPALGKLMGIDGQSVARWEKTSKVPLWADKLARLLYTAQVNGDEPIAKAVERIKTVERLIKQKIVVRESRGQWRPSLQDDDVVTH
jgi:transcriptional regulator with XRE-family HTH domain